MEVKEAATHFGTYVATGYNWIRYWNERIERLRPRKSSERTPRLSGGMLERLKRMLETKPCWSVKEARRLIKEIFGVNYSDDQVRRMLAEKLGDELR